MDEDLVYDETVPTHVRVEACRESLEMLQAGYANTYIQTVIKGRPSVSPALRAYDLADVEYRNANEAIQAYKLVLRVLEAQNEREWEQARRM